MGSRAIVHVEPFAIRGLAAVDRDALADILVRIGELGLAYPQIKEIDLNPLIVRGGKPIAVDATIVLDG